ncbi:MULTISPECIES: IS3 family transposase [unclassified Streptomyces]|uniref:IS3 family transposase n=1 Tax=unclassified Streptomyces TaxID=2593676 RepID=UPI00225AA2B5|nr:MULTISPECIES: IS3 family transposase [unclassified Streptomyces]WSP55564.1 IS3 family transposase [Streptomyces sp. NBC_01241]WSU23708.1 IS3 family transposase [Streptomyces sp. NBC_01108]MCX4787260.1 IS3 family transposase [Streptomyces sp. NBC_01221]WSJ38272.1 IS3 family transposase [Streptomyces sp. NBC_01321]WSP64560.1 IS3 family transposase [Streptomyces sp. NBC_01240]
MAMKDYSDEFKADAVALYESTPGAIYKSIAADLGVNRATLREWVLRDRERRGITAAIAKPGARPREAVPSADPDERVRQLEARVAELEASERKLATERDILRKAAKYFRRDELVRSRFQFVDDHRNTYEVKRLCQVLDVNRSSYYKWLAGAEARATRQREDRILAEEIREVHGESGGAYGSPRVTAELREKGRQVNEKRIARIMRTFSITGIRLRRRVRTTVPDPAASPVPDLFQRDFTATEPGRKYMGDITYLPLAGGEFLYLATVLDCFSRKVVGWSIADHMRTGLVADALRMAASTRGRLDGAVFHSDHGAQYGSRAFAGLCDQLGVTRSMGAVGTSADNAACESFHASLKRETLQGAHDYGDSDTCRRTVFAWLTRYNTRRRHSANGHLSPNEYEHRHHTAKLTLAA